MESNGPADWETECLEREDKKHCNCWYDGEVCCACGDATEMTDEEVDALEQRENSERE